MAEISPDTAAGLALLGQFSDPSFSSLLKWTFRNACGEDAKGKPQAMTALSDVKDLEGEDEIMIKSAHMALLTFIYEAAKTDMHPVQITSLLEDAKLPEGHIKAISGLFERCKPILRNVLSRNRISFPKLIDIEWRLDHQMRSRTLDQVREAVYLVRLKLKEPTGHEKLIEMTCNHSELADLHARLKNATLKVEKLIRGAKGK
ncbi:hypothetical protein AAMO2058_001509600 [Amorphochlora amoebiformis]|uniref:COMM domain-containing protein 3 n=1 Tax=Amorphochlora amoebiformis TaxID=1561963 RepID=A0A6T6S2Q7_9EUKA